MRRPHGCPTASTSRSTRRWRASRTRAGKALGDAEDPLLVSVRSRRARVDAGDARHGPQPRPQRRVGGTAWPRATEQRALRLGLLPALRADVRQRRASAIEGERFEDAIARRQGASAASRTTPSSTPTRCSELDARRSRRSTSSRPTRSEQLERRDPRRLRLVDGRARRRLPAHQPHPRRLGHGGQRPADGVRQQGRRQSGSRRRLQPRRGHRRAGARRRLPAPTPRARTSSPACARRATSSELDATGCPRSTSS